MKKCLTCLGLLLFSVLLVACRQPATEKGEEKGLKIVTSFYPIYALVSELSGDLNEVRMINTRAGIHDFEPSVADVRVIYDADAFIYHSAILEGWASRLDPNLKGSKVQVLEAASQLSFDKVQGLEQFTPKPGMDESSLYDPHTWLDPILVGEEAMAIADLLSSLDPSHAAIYQERALGVKEAAEALVDRLLPRFARLDQKTFVTQHTAFSYTAKRFGLKQLGITGVSAAEPTPRQLAEIKTFIENYGVQTIFTEKGVSDKLAKSLATSTGVRFAELNTLEIDPKNDLSFIENLESNLMTLLTTLERETRR